MNKNELIVSLDNAINNCVAALDNAEKPLDYVKLSERKKAFEDIKNFIAQNLDEAKSAKEAK